MRGSRLRAAHGLLARGAGIAGVLIAWQAVAQAPPPSGFPGEAPEGPPPAILSFTAEPEQLRAGETATLHWAAVNAYSLTIDPGIGAVATRGSLEVAPDGPTTYTLTVDGTGGAVSRTVRINVSGRIPATQTPSSDAVTAAPVGSRDSPFPVLPDGRPDLSGIYLGGRDVHLTSAIRLQPGAESFRVPQSDADLGQGALCLPPGVPAATMVPYPLQIVHKPNVVVILYEAYNLFRIVRVDVAHPDDLDPTWMGHSVASWDGDTLVVDVVGFNDKTRVGGYRHTDALHVVERYTPTAAGAIRYEATVEDPNVFAEPIVFSGDLVPHPEWEIGEYVCAENNKDYQELFEETE
jgi:hypothetical protein